jgi:hypothetical protein
VSPDAFGSYRDIGPAWRAVGIAVLLLSLGATVVLQRVQLALSREEASIWWASNGRDLLNAVSLGLVGLALWLVGFSGPIAVLVGATVLLLLNLFESFLSRGPGQAWPTGLAFLVALTLAAPLVIAPASVQLIVTRAVARLFS